MRRRHLITLVVVLVGVTALTLRGFSSSSTPNRNGGDGRFVMHEWGTFTSFSGSDGVKLEFRPLLDVDLPPFVLNRPRQAGNLEAFLTKSAWPVVQRMETPVTYFYTDRPRAVHVRVGFPRGLLTEFFPPVAVMKPDYKMGTPMIGDSELDWGRVWIVPEDRFQADVDDPELAQRLHERMVRRLLPASDGYEHYAHARKTDSALVYVERAADPERPYAPHGGWFEKFLFYRGIGNFELPLRLTAQGAGRFELANVGPHPIRSLFLVSVDGLQLRFAEYDEIAANGRVTMTQSDRASTVDELSTAVQTSLVKAGLYDKEATAMVDTWRSSWFGEQGTRLFYLLPEPLTDELLPLTIEPAPDERLRVMVGRLEIMSPEDESRTIEAVRQSARDRAVAETPEAREVYAKALPAPIVNLGRLTEPALVRARNVSTEAEIQYEATQLLYQLRTQQSQ